MVVLSLVLLGFACLSALTSACPLPVSIQEDSPLHVDLVSSGENAVIIANITNGGEKDLKLLNLGSILTDAPIEKVDVYIDGKKLEFEGLYYTYLFKDLGDSAFTLLSAGESIAKTIELAGLYDFSTPGPYQIVAKGALPFIDATADPSSFDYNELPAYGYNSNELVLAIDVEEAKKVPSFAKSMQRRVVATGCSGSNQMELTNALSSSVDYARMAATAAKSGSAAKFQEYFHTTSSSTRDTVAARFQSVADAASSSTSGEVTYYCNDPYGYCEPSVIAYTLPSSNIIANCDVFYTKLPSITRECHGQDRIGTVMHELTHASAVVDPFTKDFAYGYTASVGLSAEQALQNADTYAMYAQAVVLDC